MAPTFESARITHRTDWDEGLWSIVLDHTPAMERAGRYAWLALDLDGERVERPYSLASAPGAPAEFFLVMVEDGALTPPLYALGVDDEVLVTTTTKGGFTLERIEDTDILWMVSTGTGLAPYLSMLRTDEPWQRFGRIVLIHGVRFPEQLAYLDEIAALEAGHPGQLTFVPMVTRGAQPPGLGLAGRVTGALVDGRLEDHVGAPLAPANSHVMLCGNPAMIKEMRGLLEGREMFLNRRRIPGHYTVEAYW